jgi:hypothetical protein
MLKVTFNNAGEHSRNWTRLPLDRMTTRCNGGFPERMIRLPVRLLTILLVASFLAAFANAEIIYKVVPSSSNDHLFVFCLSNMPLGDAEGIAGTLMDVF